MLLVTAFKGHEEILEIQDATGELWIAFNSPEPQVQARDVLGPGYGLDFDNFADGAQLLFLCL